MTVSQISNIFKTIISLFVFYANLLYSALLNNLTFRLNQYILQKRRIEVNTNIKNTISATDNNAKYDECAKQLLAQKYILANILVKTIKEFKGMKANDVVKYIEGEPYVSIVPVEPGSTNAIFNDSSKIAGLNTENFEINEGLIRFDIIFYVRVPSKSSNNSNNENQLSQVIINIEAQKDEPKKYQIINRAVFYISRLVSSQKQRDFINMNYDDIKKVYSIWVCMGMKENTMCHIHLTKDDLIGKHNWRGNLDLLNIVMIGISDTLPEHDNTYEMHRLLAALFTDTLNAKQKIDIINKEYDIPVESDIEEGVSIMCNLSQGIEEKALEKGKAVGITQGKTSAQIDIILNMYNNNFTIEQIALATQYDVDKIKEIIQKN